MYSSFFFSLRSLIPLSIFGFFAPWYHRTLSFMGAVVYRFPSRNIKVIAITGTKGKSSTVEITSAILEEAGYRTALSNTIRFKIGADSRPNLHKMSMPGRFFMQKFLRQAVRAGMDYAVIEMTSQGVLASRHRHIELDAFVMTNISPEHIEAHGSYDNYVEAKLAIVRDGIGRSRKPNRVVIANRDDTECARFLGAVIDPAVRKMTYGKTDAEPFEIKAAGIAFTHGGKQALSPLSGLFNLYNVLAATTAARSQNVPDEIIIRAIEKFRDIPGRVEEINAGQDFAVIVDYAHTADSLEKLYRIFRPDPTAPRTARLVAVLGGTGGGRDQAKRREMGRLADLYSDEIILTNEDPYDENPVKIIADVASGIMSKKTTIVIDRRLAIRQAIAGAKKDDVILITGKGTDPYIMGPRGSKIPWSDAGVAREEIKAILKK